MEINTVLGMHLSDLSLRDISEEITDIQKDIRAIDDFKKGLIGYSELRSFTCFNPEQRVMLVDALEKLRTEKSKRKN